MPSPPAASTSNVLEQFGVLNLGSDAAAAPAAAQASRVSVSAAEASAIRSSIADLLARIDTLAAESSTPLPATMLIDAAHMSAYSVQLSHAITKFVLLTSQGDAPVSKASEDLLTHLTGTSCALRSLLSPPLHASAGAGGPGPTQRAAIVAAHTAMLTSIRQLVSQLEKHLLAKDATKLQVTLAGKAWETMEKQIAGVPLNNAVAVGRLLLQQCGLLRDAKAELAELKLAPAEGGQQKEDDDDDDDEFDDDDFDDDGDTLSAAEYALVPSATRLVNVAQQLMHAIYMYTLKTAPAAAPKDAAAASEGAAAAAASAASPAAAPAVESASRVAWLESILADAKSLCQCVDAAVAAIGEDPAETLAAIHALAARVRDVALSLVRQHRSTPGEKWPMAAAASATTDSAPAWSSCAECSATNTDAAKTEGSEASTEWLQKVIAAVHDCHTEAEAAAATAPQ